MSVVPDQLSTYRFCSILKDENDESFFTDPVPFEYREIDDTIRHVVLESDTYENLAARYYVGIPGKAQLWRVIAEFQPVIPLDATVAPAPGSIVYIPSRRTLFEDILSEKRRPDYEA